MEFPELYRNVAVLPKRDARIFLEEFTANNRWKQNAKVLDVGCGDGSTNKELLQKFVPGNFESILGSDISQQMVDYANAHYSRERVEFILWDICEDVPLQFRNFFDHVFCSYVLHWVKDQRAAFLNMYHTLVEGGNCLLLFFGYYSVYEIFRTLSRTQKWAEDLRDVEMFVSPYHDSKDPENEVLRLMKSVGFKDVDVKIWKNENTYKSREVFKDLLKSINPFHVLDKRWAEFMEDFFEVSPDGHTVYYHLIVVYGSK